MQRNPRAGCQRIDSFGIIRPVIEIRRFRADISEKEGPLMARRTIFFLSLPICFFASLPSLQAQMPPAKKDPLSVFQHKQGKCGGSAPEASSCAASAARILPIGMVSPPVADN